MRGVLEALYRGCAMLAAVFLALIGVLVVAQAAGRLVGVVVPSANELAGFSMAATSFLALAPTLRAGGHIQVGLLLARLPRPARTVAAVWCFAVALLLVGYFAWFTVDMTIASFGFGDVSPGLVAIPLWIPQAGMALGLVMLAVALAEGLVLALRGRADPFAAAGDVTADPMD